jgi:hypothetical protein
VSEGVGHGENSGFFGEVWGMTSWTVVDLRKSEVYWQGSVFQAAGVAAVGNSAMMRQG